MDDPLTVGYHTFFFLFLPFLFLPLLFADFVRPLRRALSQLNGVTFSYFVMSTESTQDLPSLRILRLEWFAWLPLRKVLGAPCPWLTSGISSVVLIPG